MLKVKIDNRLEMIIFYCPHCKIQDVIYINMPTKCWNCNEHHKVDIIDITNNLNSRFNYHKRRAS